MQLSLQTTEVYGETAFSILIEAKLSKPQYCVIRSKPQYCVIRTKPQYCVIRTKSQYCVIRSAAIANNSSCLPSYDKLKEAKKMCYPEDVMVTETSAEVAIFIRSHLLKNVSRRFNNISRRFLQKKL